MKKIYFWNCLQKKYHSLIIIANKCSCTLVALSRVVIMFSWVWWPDLYVCDLLWLSGIFTNVTRRAQGMLGGVWGLFPTLIIIVNIIMPTWSNEHAVKTRFNVFSHTNCQHNTPAVLHSIYFGIIIQMMHLSVNFEATFL